MNRETLPTAAVRVEGTLSVPGSGDRFTPGLPEPGIDARLSALRGTHRVVLFSALCETDRGTRGVLDWLLTAGIDAFDELWTGYGLPHADVVFDNDARKL